MSILEDMAPSVEVYSIDEAFMDVTGLDRLQSFDDLGRKVRARIKQEAHLNVGVGIPHIKTLAKLANHAAKSGRRPATCLTCLTLSVSANSWS